MEGHAHCDRLITSSFTGSVPILLTTCDKCLPYIHDNIQDLDTERTPGTISEQAFDVVVIDKVLRKVTAVRIGAPALDNIDNTLTDNQVEQRVFTY